MTYERRKGKGRRFRTIAGYTRSDGVKVSPYRRRKDTSTKKKRTIKRR